MAIEYGMKTLPSSYQQWGANREHGWAFTVNEKITVCGLRVYLPDAQTITASLWVSDNNTALRQTQIVSTGNKWSEGRFAEDITLQAGKTYIISCYTANCYYTSNARSASYDPRITYEHGRYGGTRLSRPNGTETNYTYPFIDILIKGPSYKAHGDVIYTLNNYVARGDDTLHWTGDTPLGTSLKLYTKVNNGAYTEVATSGGRIQGLPSSGTCTLYIKAELATTDIDETPRLNSIAIKGNDDKKVIMLNLANPNLSPAIGPITVSYDGLGGLQGIGGPSEAFDGDFTTGLTWKGNQNDEEHISFAMNASSVLTQITYSDTMEKEHIEMTFSAVATLTDIHDL